MYKVEILNQVNDRTFGGQFETIAEAKAWRDKCILKNSWGLPEREVRDITGLEDRVISQREVTIDIDDPEIPNEVYTLYTVKADYVLSLVSEEEDQDFKDKLDQARFMEEMPTLKQILWALLVGGTKLDNLKADIQTLRAKYPNADYEL
jgi:hypothetical protein